MVSGDCEVAALDLETLPRSEAGKVDAEFRLLVSTFGRRRTTEFKLETERVQGNGPHTLNI